MFGWGYVPRYKFDAFTNDPRIHPIKILRTVTTLDDSVSSLGASGNGLNGSRGFLESSPSIAIVVPFSLEPDNSPNGFSDFNSKFEAEWKTLLSLDIEVVLYCISYLKPGCILCTLCIYNSQNIVPLSWLNLSLSNSIPWFIYLGSCGFVRPETRNWMKTIASLGFRNDSLSHLMRDTLSC
jgi:hypothetical protein